ncbi:MAG TPA: hypothetical protein VF710_07390 [Longimicrobium sp.]
MAEENGLHAGDVDGEVAEAAVAEAQTLGEEDRWDEAHSLLLVTLEEQGESALLLCWAGIASQRLGNESEAYDFFRRALALQPEDPFILAAAGSGVAIYDDPDAESALRMAALTSPDFPFARAAYGAYLAREGLFAEAVGELEAARALAPEDAEIHADLGMAYLLAGRADDAWLRGVYGLALVETRRTEEGAEQLHRAAAERVEDVELQLLSALSAAGEGWQDEAWNALARAQDAADASDHEMIQEVEDALEGGDEDAVVLRDDLGPSLLRERLVQRA